MEIYDEDPVHIGPDVECKQFVASSILWDENKTTSTHSYSVSHQMDRSPRHHSVWKMETKLESPCSFAFIRSERDQPHSAPRTSSDQQRSNDSCKRKRVDEEKEFEPVACVKKNSKKLKSVRGGAALSPSSSEYYASPSPSSFESSEHEVVSPSPTMYDVLSPEMDYYHGTTLVFDGELNASVDLSSSGDAIEFENDDLPDSTKMDYDEDQSKYSDSESEQDIFDDPVLDKDPSSHLIAMKLDEFQADEELQMIQQRTLHSSGVSTEFGRSMAIKPRLGNDFQADLEEETLNQEQRTLYKTASDPGECMWEPNRLPDNEVDSYLETVKEILKGCFSEEKALGFLHNSEYKIEDAITRLKSRGDDVLYMYDDGKNTQSEHPAL